MFQKINETCKNYFEIEKPEKYNFLKVLMSTIKGQIGYLDASIWQYGGYYKCGEKNIEEHDGL